MQLSDHMQKLLTDEIDFAVRRMKDTADPPTKLYFFSAVYGAAFRVLNMEFDPELCFIHYVLSAAYSMINSRLLMLSQRQERGVGMPEKLFEKLEEALEEMLAKMQQGEQTHPVLETISNLAYSTTGNGYYLYLKGVLSI